MRKSIFNYLLTYFSFIIETIYNTRYSVTFCNIGGHVQIVILISLLLSNELLKIVYIGKTHSIWRWEMTIFADIFNKRYSVTFSNRVGHVQIVIFIWLLLSKEIIKILYIENTDSIWEWQILIIYCYINAIFMLHIQSAHVSDPLFFYESFLIL